MRKFYNGCDWGNISTSRIQTPAKLINYDGDEYHVEFYSGFFHPHLNDNGEVCMNFGYLMRADSEYEKNKLKQEYIEQGVINEGFGCVKIPNKLKDKFDEIVTCFNAYSATYYDPETYTETLKLITYYKENGVAYSNRYTVEIPEKLKDKIDEILEVFECYRFNIKN